MLLKQKGAGIIRRSFFIHIILGLTFFCITLVEPLDASGGIHHAALAGEERMAVAADFNLKLLFRGTCSEFVAAGTDDYLG
jgi:hypothetical protein